MSRTLNVSLSLLTLLFSGALLACDSPLLDHVNANDVVREPLGENADCPIAFPVHKLCASFTWDRMPTTSDLGNGQLRFWRMNEGTASGPYVDPHHTIGIEPWMTSMGHGTPIKAVVAVAKDSGGVAVPGVYEISNLSLFMPGKWDVRIQLKTAGQTHEQATFSVEI